MASCQYKLQCLTARNVGDETRDSVENLHKQQTTIADELQAEVTQSKMAENRKRSIDEQLRVLREFLTNEAPGIVTTETIDLNLDPLLVQVRAHQYGVFSCSLGSKFFFFFIRRCPTDWTRARVN